jgi:hypothetical protein
VIEVGAFAIRAMVPRDRRPGNGGARVW